MRYDAMLEEQSRYWLRGFFTACGLALIVMFISGCTFLGDVQWVACYHIRPFEDCKATVLPSEKPVPGTADADKRNAVVQRIVVD